VANRQLFEQQAKERQGTRTDINLPQNSAEGNKGEVRDKIAKIAGLSLA